MPYPPQGTGVQIGDADATESDVKFDKTFYAGDSPRKTGAMLTKAIVAESSAYEEGYHAGNPGGLEAIDPDLAPGNIKQGVTIFGKAGTLVPCDVSDADAAVGDVRSGKTFYSGTCTKKTGTWSPSFSTTQLIRQDTTYTCSSTNTWEDVPGLSATVPADQSYIEAWAAWNMNAGAGAGNMQERIVYNGVVRVTGSAALSCMWHGSAVASAAIIKCQFKSNSCSGANAPSFGAWYEGPCS